MADDAEVVLEHPDLGKDARMTFRQSEGFWNDKLAQIEVFKAGGWTEVSKSTRAPATSSTTADQK